MRLMLILFFTCLTIHAGEGTKLDLPEYFKPFAPLVGSTWVADFPSGGMVDTHTYEWVYGGKFLRNIHHVSDSANKVVYQGETIFGWDHKQKKIVWWYWNQTGGHLTGTLTFEGGKYVIDGINNAPGDQNQTDKVRGEMTIGKDGWQSSQFFWKDGQWELQFVMDFKKKS